MAKTTTVAAPVGLKTLPARPTPALPVKGLTGGKPVANTANLSQLTTALMAYGRQAVSRGRSGTSEFVMLDGRTYDQLAESCLDQWNAHVADETGQTPAIVVLVEGEHFKMDAKLKSIKARFQRALAGGDDGNARKDELHKLAGYEISVKAFDPVKGFTYIDPADNQMKSVDIPNTIYLELNPGIAPKAEAWAALQAGDDAGDEADEA